MTRVHPPRPVRRVRLLTCAVLIALGCDVRAETETTPQTLPQTLPEPEMQPAPQAGFRLVAVEFVGNTGIADAELQALAADRIGRDVTLPDLEEIARRVTALYRERGYFLAQAMVPVQEVQGGRVSISVVEGTLGNVDIDIAEDAPISAERVQKMLAPLQPGQALNGPRYERVMLLLSDLPGIRPQSVIQPGAAAGSTDLAVRVARGERLAVALEADNHGTPESGRIRVGGTLRWASPAGRGDNLDLRLLVAEGINTAFGRLAYETPVGHDGLRVGAGIARVQYELGGDFRALEATGAADIVDVSATYPLIRQRATNLFLRGALDRKDLTDEFEALGFEAEKRVRGASLGWAFEHRDQLFGGGYSSVNGVLYRGELDIRDPLSEFFDQSPLGRRTEGHFTKLVVQATRLQYLAPKLSLFLGAGAQRTNRNLDPSEQLSLGGPRAVRAYSTNEALVDEGYIANLELRYAATERLTPYVFYDAAHGAFDHDRHPLDPGSNGVSLRGYGLGLSWAKPGDYGLNATLAWRDTRAALADPRDPRLYVQFQKSF
ncbi:ShlB/FhaC/HecB family hemolysin secretion/activation protein [Luteimonas salinilitoris]|uniref:ShlB/FhaC/HecB family hemolysin secretion/activation protein n=1 Tax=Luteimonas salinilitoris TaxID=3237697 RepID=A0ABV4HTN4_9GAMM